MTSVDEARKAVGILMKQIRIEKGLEQGDVAEKLECSRPNITQYETLGVNGIDVILRFCNAMEVEVTDFFSLLAVQLSRGGTAVSLERLKETLSRSVKDMCARESLRCHVSISIIR